MSDMKIGATHSSVFAPPEKGEKVRNDALNGAPQFPIEELGYAGRLAQLVSESAKESASSARQMAKFEQEAQARALDRQVSALMDKAADTRAEGITSGALGIAGGVATVASTALGPMPSDDAKAAQWNQAAADYANKPGGTAFAGVARNCTQQIKNMQAASDAVKTLGSTMGQSGTQLSHGIYGSLQIKDEAASTRAASDAKFHEASKDEYESLAKEARGVADKVNQFVQSVLGEKQVVMRAILKSA